MYCYTRIRVDNKLYANLEHAIEKNNSDKLIECVPNIGLSCSVCNQTFKRIGEKKPMGIRGSDSKEMLTLQYNVMKMEFEPAENMHTYSDRELGFMKAHINRFHLNDPEFRSRQLFDFVRNVIDNNGKMPVYEYNNLIVKLFCQKLTGRSQEDILKICKKIFVIAFPKM